MSKTVLVVAAHPDDEALGCGGTIARHSAEGDDVYVFFMTNGVGAREKSSQMDAVIRNEAAEAACLALGAKRYIYHDFPDNQLDTVSLLSITQVIEIVISQIKPNIIYTHHYGDLNIDHRRTHEAVMTACRPQPNFCVKGIYTFEVLSATEWNSPHVAPFTPNCFVDISAHMDLKMKSIEVYSDEMRHSPHARSVDNVLSLARYRGSSVGLGLAEAFMVTRSLI